MATANYGRTWRIRKAFRSCSEKDPSPTSLSVFLRSKFDSIHEMYPLHLVKSDPVMLVESLRRIGVLHSYYAYYEDRTSGKMVQINKKWRVWRFKQQLRKRRPITVRYLEKSREKRKNLLALGKFSWRNSANRLSNLRSVHRRLEATSMPYLDIASHEFDSLDIDSFGDYLIGKTMIERLNWTGKMRLFVAGRDKGLIRDVRAASKVDGLRRRIVFDGIPNDYESDSTSDSDSDSGESDSDSDSDDDGDDGGGDITEEESNSDEGEESQNPNFFFQPPSDEDNN